MPLTNPKIVAVVPGGNTAGVLATVSSGTLVLAGGSNITISQDGQSVSVQAGNYITTAMASNRASDFVQATAAFAGTSASGTIGSAGISVSVGPYITTAMASNRGSDFVQATAAFAGTSASGTIASNGISVSIGPYITTGMASNRGSDFIQANAGFHGTSASGTIASDGISVSIGPYITTAMASNRGSDFVQANAAFAGTNASGTIASNGISVSVDAGGGGLTNVRVSAGTTSNLLSAVTFADSNGVSWGLNASTITATVKTDYLTTARASNDAVGLNTALTGNGVAWTVNSNGLSLNVPAFLTTAALSNHSHGNPTLALTNLSGTTESASNGFTLSLSAGAGGPGGGATLSEWCPYPEMNILSASALVNNSIYFNQVDVPENLNAYRANFFLSVATLISASNNTKSAGWTISFCLYSRGSDTNSTRLESILSRSAYMRLSASSNSNVSYSHPIGISNSTAVSSVAFGSNATNASTYGVNSVGGYRVLPFPVSSTLTPGRYWMAVAVSSQSANAQGLLAASVAQQTHGSNIVYMPFGTSSKASNASWPQVFAGRGVYSATSGAFPATVNMITDHIRALATTVVLPFFNISGYTTRTNIL